jgi:predicted membrane chloride channel (bestrophin family)
LMILPGIATGPAPFAFALFLARLFLLVALLIFSLVAYALTRRPPSIAVVSVVAKLACRTMK